MRTAPYGTWDSPLTPDAMVGGERRVGFPGFDPRGAPTWTETCPNEGGRVVVCRFGDGGVREELTPRGFSARTRVHEYGGRPHVFDGDALWCVNDADQRLARLERGVVTLRSAGEGWRFAEPLVDARRDRLVAVAERHEPPEHQGRQARNGLASVCRRTGEVRWLVEGFDFVASPALSPSGELLAFLVWDHPHMSWDAAALYVASIFQDGEVGVPVRVAGGPDGSVNQLAWLADGSLAFTLEVDDRWQPHVWAHGEVRRVADVPGELGVPLWSLGTRVFASPRPGELVAVANREGTSRVVRVHVATGEWETLHDDLWHVSALAAQGDEVLVAVGTLSLARWSPARPVEVLAGPPLRSFPPPEALAFGTSGAARAHAWLHLPEPHGFGAPEGTVPPLLVVAHGGPTGSASPLPSAPVRFWTTRGFAVLDVNYRGSTGFGRAYRQALRGQWGVLDVTDCVAGARHLAAAGRVRADAMFVRGGSAGGFTVLQALCDHDVFRGGASHFGVSDPRVLTAETHKFESRYDAFLFGEGDAFERAMEERTPLDHPERIDVPVIFFHGLEDLAVPPSQSVRLHEALVAKGLASECHLYEGEQHGFRKADTLRDVWTRELGFYRRLLEA